MLVCHCNLISESEIEDAIKGLLAEEEWRLIVPVQVYREMDKRGRCCGCFPNVVSIIIRVTEAWHREKAHPEAEVVDFVDRLKREHSRIEAERTAMRARLPRRGAA